LRNRLVRAVGDPRKRFGEDGLRILRAVRFSAVYGFEIERETAVAADELRGLIHNISGERIAQELNKIAMAHFGKDKVTSLALLFFSLDMNEESTRRFMRKLKYDNDTFYKVVKLVKYFLKPIAAERIPVKWGLNLHGEEMFFRLCDVRGAVEAAALAREIVAGGECYSLKQLAVNGRDLLEIGYKGKDLGNVLAQLQCAVIDEKCENSKDKLLKFLNGIEI
jgi:tRNA nucleotidyltransferase (CCA-adding enzyme)